jgi:lactoylglutathione lyase
MKLGYVIIYVPDVAAAVAFYETAFGLKRRFVHESHQYAEMETGATALAFVDQAFVAGFVPPFHPNVAAGKPAGVEIALVSDDVTAAYAQALAAGAKTVLAPMQKPWGQTVSYVRDLNGCLVEICSPMAPQT